jgi:carboxyl-terminal processing protease
MRRIALVSAFAALLTAVEEPQPFPEMAPTIGSLIQRNYYDPSRFNPVLMVERALRAIEAAEITCDGQWKDGKLTLRLMDRTTTIPAPAPATLRDAMQLIERIRDQVDESTLDPERKRRLAYALVNGALSTLDPHTYVEAPEPAKQSAFEDITGEFFGIGAYLGMDDGVVTIERVMPGLPAERSGVEDGDKILAIDGERTAGLALDQAVRRIKGPKGTPVRLTLERKGTGVARDVTVVRDLVQVVMWRLHRQQDVAYFRLDAFNGNAARELANAWLELDKSGKPKALIIDLRMNGGGLLDQAKLISDFFLDRGKEVVRTVSTDGDSTTMMSSNRSRFIDVPVMILVSGISASASEILAGALQRNDRAVVIGATTYGKGSVQVMRSLRDGSRMRITTSEYQLPGGVSIQDLGVAPDIHLVRRSVREADGGVVDLLPYSPPREVDDEFALKNRSSYQHKTTYELGWLAQFQTVEELKKSSISAREFRPDQEAQLVLDLAAAAVARPDFAAGWEAALSANRGRQYFLKALNEPVSQRAEVEAKALGAALSKLPTPVNWGEASDIKPGSLTASFTGPLRVVAGTKARLGFRVDNVGATEAGRLYGVVQADKGSPLWESEVVFGAVAPNGSVTGTLTWDVPPRLIGGEEQFNLEIRGGRESTLFSIPAAITVEGRPRPHLAFRWRLKNDAQVKRGQPTTVQIRLRNDGGDDTAKLALRVFKDDDPYLQLTAPEPGAIAKDGVKAGTESEWIDLPISLAAELKGQPWKGDHLTLELNVQEQFDDRRPELGRNRAGLAGQFKIPVEQDIPSEGVLVNPPRLDLVEVQGDSQAAKVTVTLNDDNPAFVTAFLDEDKVFLTPAKAGPGSQRFTIPVTLKPGANTLRIVATDQSDLAGALPLRLWRPQPAPGSAPRPTSEVPTQQEVP